MRAAVTAIPRSLRRAVGDDHVNRRRRRSHRDSKKSEAVFTERAQYLFYKAAVTAIPRSLRRAISTIGSTIVLGRSHRDSKKSEAVV